MADAQHISTRRAFRGLMVMPVIATVLALFIGWYYETQEPFGGFIIQDALIELGGPVLLLGLWVWWFLLGRRRAASRTVWIVGAVWCGLTLWTAGYYVFSYCRQPWAWYVPGS